MTSKVGIINVALRRLGQEPITSVTEGSRAANLASPHYDELLPVLLRAGSWGWATRQVQLSLSAVPPVSTYDYQFPIPADFIRAVTVSADDSGVTNVIYRIANDATAGRVFQTNSNQLYLTYVSSLTDPAIMPPDFRYALSMMLARDLAIPLTNSRAMEESMAAAAREAWLQAIGTDAIEDFPDQRPIGSWAAARQGGRWRFGDWRA